MLGAGAYLMALMDGASKEDALELLAQDFLQPDPVAAFDAQRPKLRATFSAPGAAERIGHHVIADMTGAQLLRGCVSETAVHTWDIIEAAGIDEPLDPQLAEVSFHPRAPRPDLRRQRLHRAERRDRSRRSRPGPHGRPRRPPARRPPALSRSAAAHR